MFNLAIKILSSVLIGAGILTPLTYTIIRMFYPSMDVPFSRVFDRVILFVFVACVIHYRKELKLPSIKSWRSGFNLRDKFLLITKGFLISLSISLLGIYFVVNDSHALRWSHDSLTVWMGRVLGVAITAIVVSILEELIFRGVIYKRLSLSLGFLMAAAISSVLYAIVHFIAPVKSFEYPGLDLFAGFQYIGVAIGRLFSPGILSGIFGLWLVGMVLCEAYKRSGFLALGIGLHAGWIFAVKFAFYATEVVDPSYFPEGLGRRYFLVGEPAGWASILLVYFAVRSMRREIK